MGIEFYSHKVRYSRSSYIGPLYDFLGKVQEIQVIVVLWFSKVYGYYTTQRVQPILENHSAADLYYDATNQTLGSV